MGRVLADWCTILTVPSPQGTRLRQRPAARPPGAGRSRPPPLQAAKRSGRRRGRAATDSANARECRAATTQGRKACVSCRPERERRNTGRKVGLALTTWTAAAAIRHQSPAVVGARLELRWAELAEKHRSRSRPGRDGKPLGRRGDEPGGVRISKGATSRPTSARMASGAGKSSPAPRRRSAGPQDWQFPGAPGRSQRFVGYGPPLHAERPSGGGP
jgi:hypothetical protein